MISNTRRNFMQGIVLAGGTAMAARAAMAAEAAPKAMTMPMPAPSQMIDHSPLTQPTLPFAPDALDPVISPRTVDFHYNKHHKGYFTNLEKLVAGTELAQATLEEVLLAASGHADRKAIFNNAAQAWNHNLYWQSLSPVATAPSALLAAAIVRDFAAQEALEAELIKAATGQFGSGWAWVVLDAGKLRVVATSNAENPMTLGQVPLVVVDVWEHAYYLDYQNRRADHVAAVVKGHLNWSTASTRFAAATRG